MNKYRKDPTKHHLRERLKHARASLTTEERAEKSRAIAGILLGLLEGVDTVMVYVAKEPEVETLGLIEALLERGTAVVVPIIQRETRTLRLSYLEDTGVLLPSTFHVPEPVGHEIPADGGSIGAAVIPLIGFDDRCHRLGYGAGYYDRFLGTHPGVLRIGVGFACQRADRIPAEAHDIALHCIVTEDGVTRAG
ncbi:MAG TPA: 5-formyltetrahydrofolate cyclo-ligase [Methanoculleus sp.]|nr:5-formyltetrahydrofolate cyclo-ligase [Methanoculleus sp.]